MDYLQNNNSLLAHVIHIRATYFGFLWDFPQMKFKFWLLHNIIYLNTEQSRLVVINNLLAPCLHPEMISFSIP